MSVIESRYHPQVVEELRARDHDVLQRADFDPGLGTPMPSNCCGMAMAMCRRPSLPLRIPSEGSPAVW
jgi:hypothetical protein